MSAGSSVSKELLDIYLPVVPKRETRPEKVQKAELGHKTTMHGWKSCGYVLVRNPAYPLEANMQPVGSYFRVHNKIVANKQIRQ